MFQLILWNQTLEKKGATPRHMVPGYWHAKFHLQANCQQRYIVSRECNWNVLLPLNRVRKHRRPPLHTTCHLAPVCKLTSFIKEPYRHTVPPEPTLLPAAGWFRSTVCLFRFFFLPFLLDGIRLCHSFAPFMNWQADFVCHQLLLKSHTALALGGWLAGCLVTKRCIPLLDRGTLHFLGNLEMFHDFRSLECLVTNEAWLMEVVLLDRGVSISPCWLIALWYMHMRQPIRVGDYCRYIVLVCGGIVGHNWA